MPNPPITGQELLGILSARLVHNLSNYAAALSGNLLVCESPNATDLQKAAALASIREANRRAADLLDRFSCLTRTLQSESPPCPLPNLITHLYQWIDHHPNWTLQIAPQLSTQPLLALPGPWPWLQHILETLATKIHPPAHLRLDPAPNPIHPRPLQNHTPAAHITLIITAAAIPPIDWRAQPETPSDWNQTAAYELLTRLGSRPTDTNTPSTTTTLLLPLIQI